MPFATPVTTPVAVMVATPVDKLLHTPPPTASVSVELVVGQSTSVPDMLPATGDAFTVTTAVAAAVPQLFVTV